MTKSRQRSTLGWTASGAAFGAHLFFTRATCYTPWPPDRGIFLPRVTGLRSAPCVPLARESDVMLPACSGGVLGPGRVGGVTPVERRKGRNMAKATRSGQKPGHPVRPCVWCAHPVHG